MEAWTADLNSRPSLSYAAGSVQELSGEHKGINLNELTNSSFLRPTFPRHVSGCLCCHYWSSNVSLLHNCGGTGILDISGPGSKSLPPSFFHEATLESVFGTGKNYFFSSRCQVISRKIVFLVTSYYILASHLVWVANSFYWQPLKNQRSFFALIYETKQNNTREEHSRGFTFSNSHLCLISSECS